MFVLHLSPYNNLIGGLSIISEGDIFLLFPFAIFFINQRHSKKIRCSSSCVENSKSVEYEMRNIEMNSDDIYYSCLA